MRCVNHPVYVNRDRGIGYEVNVKIQIGLQLYL
jgi:hypothetical protein